MQGESKGYRSVLHELQRLITVKDKINKQIVYECKCNQTNHTFRKHYVTSLVIARVITSNLIFIPTLSDSFIPGF